MALNPLLARGGSPIPRNMLLALSAALVATLLVPTPAAANHDVCVPPDHYAAPVCARTESTDSPSGSCSESETDARSMRLVQVFLYRSYAGVADGHLNVQNHCSRDVEGPHSVDRSTLYVSGYVYTPVLRPGATVLLETTQWSGGPPFCTLSASPEYYDPTPLVDLNQLDNDAEHLAASAYCRATGGVPRDPVIPPFP